MAIFRSILICVPTTGQSMKSGTALTITDTVKTLIANGLHVDVHNIDSAEIVTARDMFANMVLHSDAWDSLLFIDSDMAFGPNLVPKLINRSADVAAAACPRRRLHLDQFLARAREHGNLDKAVAQASEFTVNLRWSHQPNKAIKIKDGFCTAAAVGMAIALISKAALEAMIEAKVVRPRLDLNAGEGKTCWSFFENLEEEGSRLGEDYSFCHRWTAQMKRELSVCVDEPVTHIGQYEYRARYLDLF